MSDEAVVFNGPHNHVKPIYGDNEIQQDTVVVDTLEKRIDREANDLRIAANVHIDARIHSYQERIDQIRNGHKEEIPLMLLFTYIRYTLKDRENHKTVLTSRISEN